MCIWILLPIRVNEEVRGHHVSPSITLLLIRWGRVSHWIWCSLNSIDPPVLRALGQELGLQGCVLHLAFFLGSEDPDSGRPLCFANWAMPQKSAFHRWETHLLRSTAISLTLIRPNDGYMSHNRGAYFRPPLHGCVLQPINVSSQVCSVKASVENMLETASFLKAKILLPGPEITNGWWSIWIDTNWFVLNLFVK